jgi:hypothetical protein
MRGRCREIDVPFLYIGCDPFDRRYTTRRDDVPDLIVL